jgi:hypothetical protein
MHLPMTDTAFYNTTPPQPGYLSVSLPGGSIR